MKELTPLILRNYNYIQHLCYPSPLVFCLEKGLKPKLDVAREVIGSPMLGFRAGPESSVSLGGGALGNEVSSASASVSLQHLVDSSQIICVMFQEWNIHFTGLLNNSEISAVMIYIDFVTDE